MSQMPGDCPGGAWAVLELTGALRNRMVGRLRPNDEKMSCKIGNAQSRATFFRHAAVLNLPAVLLPKLPNIMKQRALVLILSLSGCIFSKLIS